MPHVNPKMLARLDELETDLVDRRTRAQAEGWADDRGSRHDPHPSSEPNVTTPTTASSAGLSLGIPTFKVDGQ